MALFGSDRPILPSFKTTPDLDPSERSPYDDLNRLPRTPERNSDRARGDELTEAEQRARELLERALDRNGRDLPPSREESREIPPPVPVKADVPLRVTAEGTDPLIQGLFSKLPVPETEWPLTARQKWLQTAANIFDLMYAPHQGDAGELAIRVERGAVR